MEPNVHEPPEASVTQAGGLAASRTDIRREPAKPAPKVGRYTVLDRLGAGAMGQVFAAYDPKLDRRVALKFLHAHGTPVDAERLAREARALALLSHPNVITVHEVAEFEGQLAVAMEFVEGQTLHRWMLANWECPDRQLRSDRALALLRQACDGLAAAHDKGLVHRDFKPANVLVGDDGRVRVADFGLARRLQDAPSSDASRSSAAGPPTSAQQRPLRDLTEDGTTVGTRAYMAPEQLAGSGADARSDQYSFCVVAWQVLFGTRPRIEASPHLTSSIPAPEPRRAAKVPRRVEDALRRGLAGDPSARHGSMLELRDHLEPAARRNKHGSRRRRPWRQLAVGGTVIAALIGGRALHQHTEQTRCESHARSIEEVWNTDVSLAVTKRFLQTGTPYAQATAQRVPFWLEKYSSAWQETMQHACSEARVHNRWSPATFDKAQWCLEERRAAFQSLVDGFLEADAHTTRIAIGSAADLEGAAPCIDKGWLRRTSAPPSLAGRYAAWVTWSEMGAAKMLAESTRTQDAVTLAHAARVRAQQTGWQPLLASSWLREGEVLVQAGDFANAEVALRESYRTSISAGQWITATLAAVALADVVGSALGQLDQGELWLDLGASMNARSADPFGLRERILTDRRGQLHFLRGDHVAAVAAFEGALGHARAIYGTRHPRVALALQHLGNGLAGAGRLAEAEEVFRESADTLETLLGTEHPLLVGPLMGLAATLHVQERDAEAKPIAERTLHLIEAEHGPDHSLVATGLHSLAAALVPLGEHERAEALLLRSLTIQRRTGNAAEPRYSGTLDTLATLYSASGDEARAEATLERAVQGLESAFGKDNPRLIDLLNNLAITKTQLGRRAEALAAFQRSVKIGEKTRALPSISLTRAYAGVGRTAIALDQLPIAQDALDASLKHLAAGKSGPDLTTTRLQAQLAEALWSAAEPTHHSTRRNGHALMRAAARAFQALGADEDRQTAETWLQTHPVR